MEALMGRVTMTSASMLGGCEMLISMMVVIMIFPLDIMMVTVTKSAEVQN